MPYLNINRTNSSKPVPHSTASSTLVSTMPSQPLPMEQTARTPLRDSTNNLHSQQASSSSSTQQPSKPLQRKLSVRFSPSKKAYTSDSDPSEHSSIFDALLCSPQRSPEHTETGEGSSLPHAAAENEQIFITGGRRSPTRQHGSRHQQSATGHVVHPATAPPLRSLHVPTPLSTITEQPSSATLRPSRKASLLTLLSHRPSAPHLISKLKSQHKKRSFSDVGPLTSNRTNGTSSAASSMTYLSPTETTRYPSQPLAPPPPERCPTPPGLPTFNTPAAVNYRLPPPQLGLRDLFRLTCCPEEDEYRRQTIGLPKGVVMRGEGGVFVRGRWRPDRSAHTGTSGLPPNIAVRRVVKSRGLPMEGFTRQGAENSIPPPRFNAVTISTTRSLPQPTPGQADLSENLQLRGSTRHEADTVARFPHVDADADGCVAGRFAEQAPSAPPARTWWQFFKTGGFDRSHALHPPLSEFRESRVRRCLGGPAAPTQPDPHLLHSNLMQTEVEQSEPNFFFYSPSTPQLSQVGITRTASNSSERREVKRHAYWKRLSGGCCLVCCGAEKSEEDGGSHPCGTNLGSERVANGNMEGFR